MRSDVTLYRVLQTLKAIGLSYQVGDEVDGSIFDDAILANLLERGVLEKIEASPPAEEDEDAAASSPADETPSTDMGNPITAELEKPSTAKGKSKKDAR